MTQAVTWRRQLLSWEERKPWETKKRGRHVTTYSSEAQVMTPGAGGLVSWFNTCRHPYVRLPGIVCSPQNNSAPYI